MKSYNHLYENCISEENRRISLSLAKHSKRMRKIIKSRHLSDDALVALFYDWINNYENAEHVPVYIYDGITRKERVIIVPTMEELIVQHNVVNALKPMFCKGLDHYIKERLGAVHYMRYMDDMVIFGSNKKVLHRTRQAISDYLENELGLSLKDNWQVFRFSYGNDKGRDLDFMGFRFFRNRTILRKTIMYKATKKARKLSRKEKPTIHDARQMLSYLGWIDCTDTYRMYQKWIKPFVNFKQLKRKISQHDRYDDRRVYRKLVKPYSSKGG